MLTKLELLRVGSVKLLLTTSTLGAFIISYLTDIYVAHITEYIAIVAAVLIDGFFGIYAGYKREGFKTFKALNILKTLIIWLVLLSVILIIQIGVPVTDPWLSQTILAPFLIFQLISTIKNMSLAGFIKSDLLKMILRNIDKHKEMLEPDDTYTGDDIDDDICITKEGEEIEGDCN